MILTWRACSPARHLSAFRLSGRVLHVALIQTFSHRCLCLAKELLTPDGCFVLCTPNWYCESPASVRSRAPVSIIWKPQP